MNIRNAARSFGFTRPLRCLAFSRYLFIAAILLLSAIWPAIAAAQFVQAPTNYVRLEPLASIGTAGVDIKNNGIAGDDRLYVVGQSGAIRVIQNGALVGTPFLSFSTAGVSLATGGERGLLGMAFHPDFNNSGNPLGYRKVYTYSSEPTGPTPTFNHPELSGGDHLSVIREWTLSGTNSNTIDTSLGSRVVMRINQPQNNHNGGALAFGPDGFLYIALGDGGGSNDNNGGIGSTTDGHTNSAGPGQPHGNGQDVTNVYGKILRISPTTQAIGGTTLSANGEYRIPNSNPFAASAGVDEIYAYGLRNPFHMSFDRTTGDLWAGDVGQGSREEVNKIVLGGNYGWVTKEGTNVLYPSYPTAGLIDPVGQYSNTEGHSVIGGFIYRGTRMTPLIGQYIFADAFGGSFTGGRLMVMDPTTGVIRDLTIDPTGSSVPGNLYGFGEDTNGELYAVFAGGQVMAIVPEPSTWILLAGGLAALCGWQLRRRRLAMRV